MKITDSFNMAAKTLVANKLRSGLTMLGIVIGNASVIMMIGVGEGTQKLAVDQLKYLGPNTIFIAPGSPKFQDIIEGGVAKNSESIETAEFQIANLLRVRHKLVGEDDFTIDNQKSALKTVSTITEALTLLLGAIAGISLFVGGIGVMNIMLVSVTERTQEIGLRKASGATRSDILMQFTIEAIVLSTLGGIIGILIGVGSFMPIGKFTPLQPEASLSAILLSVGVSSSIGLFFGIVPARQAAKLDPIAALRKG